MASFIYLCCDVTFSFLSLINLSVLGISVVEMGIVWSAKVFGRANIEFLLVGTVFVEESQCVGAKSLEGKGLFSLRMMCMFCSNWQEIMNSNDRNMCACETCQSMNDLQTAYLAKIGKILSWVKPTLLQMPD